MIYEWYFKSRVKKIREGLDDPRVILSYTQVAWKELRTKSHYVWPKWEDMHDSSFLIMEAEDATYCVLTSGLVIEEIMSWEEFYVALHRIYSSLRTINYKDRFELALHNTLQSKVTENIHAQIREGRLFRKK